MHSGSESIRTTRGFSAVPSYLTVPEIVLSPGSGGGGAGAAAGSGVAAGAELGLGDPHATANTRMTSARATGTRLNIELSRYGFAARKLE
jgi:hypothetical protein